MSIKKIRKDYHDGKGIDIDIKGFRIVKQK